MNAFPKVMKRLTPDPGIRYKTSIWYLGKRGAIPPLPRNCKRGERERAEMQPLGNSWEGSSWFVET